jgi:hypothetical protein
MLESMIRFGIIEYLKKSFLFSRRNGNSLENIKSERSEPIWDKTSNLLYRFLGNKLQRPIRS